MCETARVGRSARRLCDKKSRYLDFLLLVLALPLVRSHREVEFRLDVVHICKRRSKGVEVKKSVYLAINRPRSSRGHRRSCDSGAPRGRLRLYVPHSSSMAATVIIRRASCLRVNGEPASRTWWQRAQPESSEPYCTKEAACQRDPIARASVACCACAPTDREIHAISPPFSNVSSASDRCDGEFAFF